MLAALSCQVALVVYHQVTTWIDLFPFNGSRNYTMEEKLLESGDNGVLMALPPIGFATHNTTLMRFGVVYYVVLFAIELLVWWLPYLTTPSGRWLAVYNRLLSFATSDFSPGDVSTRWRQIYNRLHRETTRFLPDRGNRVVPNLEHSILHAWTLITALVTAGTYFNFM
jgi:hypothetical protein